MNKLIETILTSDIKSSMKLASVVKIIKFFTAIAIVIAYLNDFQWLHEIIIIAVVLNLLLPMNFFDIFIQKLLEYNTQKVEERIILNAEQTNRYLEENDKFKKSVNDKLKSIKTKIGSTNDL